MTIIAGINKLVVKEEAAVASDSKIAIPDHLLEKKYKVISVGRSKTSFEIPHCIEVGDFVRILPNSAHKLEEGGDKYLVCSVDDVLCKVK